MKKPPIGVGGLKSILLKSEGKYRKLSQNKKPPELTGGSCKLRGRE